MPTVSGHVYYDNTNLFTPSTGIANVPVALFDPAGLNGAVALTDATGAFSFTNVPNGTYQLIEAWGTSGGVATPVDYPVALIPMPTAPVEAEPPLSALSVAPPALADNLQALTPNLLNITVAGVDIPNQNFFDGPVGNKPLTISGMSSVGPNLITVADNGTWGSYPPGTLGNTRPATDPYPGVVPGFTYTNATYPLDSQFSVTNTAIGWAGGPWWITSDHTTGLETGRFQMVNGANPGNKFFSQAVTVTPNTNYALAAWVMNLINLNGPFPPQLGIEVLDANGNVLISQAVNPIPKQSLPVWFQNGFIFNSGTNSSLTVQLTSLGPAATGNDYAIDDITLFELQNLISENKTFTPSTVYSQTGVGETATVTVTVSNPTALPINNVVFQDIINPNLTFVAGSVTIDGSPSPAADPNVGFTLGTLAPAQTVVVEFQVTTTTGPIIVPNFATISYDAFTSSTGDVTRVSFPTNTAELNVVVNNAVVTTTKTVDKAFAKPGDVLTYTLTLNNSGNVPANNVVITDNIPTGTTYVSGSVTGATGTPPTLTLLAPISAGDTAIVTFQVQVSSTIPVSNPLVNSATAAFTFTVDPSNPDGADGSSTSNAATTQINGAIVTTAKTVNAAYAEIGQILTYTITVQNTGNVPASNVIITDAVPSGTTFVPGSVTGALGTPPSLTLPAALAPNGTAVVTFQVQVGDTFPTPNPIVNTANTSFTYTVDPAQPNGASGNAPSNSATTQVNDANITTVKTVDKAVSDVGQVLTYTIVLTNTGNVIANNVVITDPAPVGTTFINGSLIGATGAPPTLNVPSIVAGGSAIVSYQVLIGDTIPNPNPIANVANVAFTFTLDPVNPDGQTGSSTSNAANTQVNSAIIATVKTADKSFADVGETITYTITVTNSGNATANNVVLTDALPLGVTFVAGSLVGATGTPPTLTLNAPVPAGGSAVVSYQVLVGANVPSPNPVENSASAAFTYTVNSAQPNGASGVSYSNVVETEVTTAKLIMQKSVDKLAAYLNDTITYQIALTNTGNAPANNVIITDPIPFGTVLVPGSMTVSVPYTALPGGAIQLTNSVLPGETVAISFAVLVIAIPNPNPIINMADAAFTYTVDPQDPDGVSAVAQTNAVTTTVFRNNFGQQISDLIESVALEQAALAAIANAEGAKIQRMAAMSDITPHQLLCLNKSVADMMDSIAMLEAVLKQKLSIVDCQMNGIGC